MAVYLVRHAIAVGRSAWKHGDEERPLTKRGERQAQGLVDLLAPAQIRRMHTSPTERCRATVRPLADKLGLDPRDAPELMEGGDNDKAIGLLCRDAAKKGDSVLCTHGDVVPDLLRRLAAEGLRLPDQVRWPKGSTWVLDWDGDQFSIGHFLPPPA